MRLCHSLDQGEGRNRFSSRSRPFRSGIRGGLSREYCAVSILDPCVRVETRQLEGVVYGDELMLDALVSFLESKL